MHFALGPPVFIRSDCLTHRIGQSGLLARGVAELRSARVYCALSDPLSSHKSDSPTLCSSCDSPGRTLLGLFVRPSGSDSPTHCGAVRCVPWHLDLSDPFIFKLVGLSDP